MCEETEKVEIVLDEFHYHEALDRSYLAADIIETMLINHPVFNKHTEIKAKIEKAQELIVEAYQEIGGISIKLFTDPSELPDFMQDKE
jgi:hypothetical protein